MNTYQVTVYDGPHYTKPRMADFYLTCARTQVVEDAKHVASEYLKAKGHKGRCWVDILEDMGPVYHLLIEAAD
jgi:hypothetical protein